ncbi:MAG: OmpA family protein [Deferribacteraceae bacterium]|jgi:chemotaxis protein MotB|nr:OmpA family protein [Deferribacteraceae bacterium]
MSKKQHHEEHEEHADETWLVPYADVLTLLLALFIVLFAMSQVDATKMQAMAESFSVAFSGSLGVMSGQPILIPMTQPAAGEEQSREQRETDQLQELQENIQGLIGSQDLKGQLETRMVEEGLLITIKDELLFRSGSATILPSSEPVAKGLATLLTTISQKVAISGHTDNIPINTAEFPTNWDLSSKRAVNFLRYMLERESLLRPERFSAIGYGEFRPMVPNSTAINREKNRRVEILIMRDYPTGRGFDYNNEP